MTEILEIFASEYCEVESTQSSVEAPLLPTESSLWDPTLVPSPSQPVALAKNSLQYLSLSDYLSREYELTRRESYYAVREDLAAAVLKMRARLDLAGATVFTGLSRMAVPLTSFSLTAVRRAGVGETVPREVAGEVVFSVRGLKGERREGWESVREHSILFLVHVVARNRDENEYSFGQELRKEVPISVGDIDRVDFLEKEGILVIRGCEVVSMEDEEGVTLNDASSPDIREKRAGKKRRLKSTARK